MNTLCPIHHTQPQITYCPNCPYPCLTCPHCFHSQPHQTQAPSITAPHQFITQFTLSDFQSSCRKYRVKQLVDKYFKEKKRQFELDLSDYLVDVGNFIDGIPVEESEEFIRGFVGRVRSGMVEETCGEMYKINQKLKGFRSNLNPENEGSEEDRMKLFDKFEQHCLEFKINSRNAIKELKKRIQGALRVQSPPKVSKYLFSQSKVIENISQSKLLSSFFKTKIKTSDLLYRASDFQFCSSQFHYKCDGIRNTLTLIKNQHNKTIGGFSPQPWSSNLGYVPDPSKDTFIFSLTMGEKMSLTGKYGIWNSTSYGPAFGYGNFGHDLCVCDRADRNKASYAEFPLSFNNAKKYENSQETWEMFSGAKKGNNFIVREWEVWRVEFEQ